MPSAARERTTKEERVQARVNADTKDLLERAARYRGVSLSDFMVSSASEAATRTVQEHTLIHLSAQDSRAFAEALLNPPAPNDALRQAKERHDKLVKR